MKTIGFVDYYISEWHANNYPAWIKEISEATGEDFIVKYAWAEEYISPVDGRNTDEWCKSFDVEKCETIDELCKKADYILVLAPGNPEKHLGYAKEVLKHQKNTYIDKTFAPDFQTAKQIFELAEKYGTRFFSTSALRCAKELDDLVGVNAVITLGGGESLDEYIIHLIEMAQKVICESPTAVRVEKQGEQYICSITFENNKKATLIFAPTLRGYSVCTDTASKPISSPFFKELIADILRFYKTGEASFDIKQTLDIMKIREAILTGRAALGEWIKL